MNHDEIEDEIEDEMLDRLHDPLFGLDPYVLPQFELLVAEGRITQEFADRVIAERIAAGFPMNPSELQVRPLPANEKFVWLEAIGGPVILEGQHEVELGGITWNTPSYASSDLTHHIYFPNGAHRGWMTISSNSVLGKVEWQFTHTIFGSFDAGNAVTATASGCTSSLQEAISEILNIDISESEIVNGHSWYRHGSGLITVVDGLKIVLRELRVVGGSNWSWERDAPSDLRPILKLISKSGNESIEGYTDTREAAIANSLSSIDELRGAIATVINPDIFEAGREAGRQEIKKQVLHFFAPQ